MSVRPSTRDVCRHEAHHVASLMLDGLTPALARVDRPDDDAGQTIMDWERYQLDQDIATRMLIAVLQGPLVEGDLRHDWTWPIQPDEWQDGCRKDAEVAQSLAAYIGLDHVEWTRVLYLTRRRAMDRRFRRLAVAVAYELEDREILFAHELETIAEEVANHH